MFTEAENPRQSENLEQLLTQDPSQLARQDYLTAIGLLQQAESRDLLTDNARLLLARLKLAYGLYAEAGFDLHAVGSEGVSGRQQNRAWYELAVAYYGKANHYLFAEQKAFPILPIGKTTDIWRRTEL